MPVAWSELGLCRADSCSEPIEGSVVECDLLDILDGLKQGSVLL